MDELLNTHPEELVVHQWLNPDRVLMGIISAKLANNPRYNELVKIYREKLEKAPANYKREFERLILLLQNLGLSSKS